jgi:hypothetical protein
MVNALLIRKVFEAIIDKLPHRPANDDDCRELFKKVVSKMQKGAIRKEIIANLEEYFATFEELIVAKSTDSIASEASKASKPSEKSSQIDASQLAFFANKQTSRINLNSVLVNFINGSVSVRELLAELSQAAHFPSLKAIWDGDSSFDSVLEGVISSIAFVGSGTEDQNGDLCCLLALCFLLSPVKRHCLVALLLARQSDDNDRVCTAISFVGHVGFWGECLRASDQAQWFIDKSVTGGSSSGSGADESCQFGAEILISTLELVVLPALGSSKHRTSSGVSGLDRLGRSCSVESAVSLTTALVLFGVFCGRHCGGAAETCAAKVAVLLDRELANKVSVWESVHAQLSQVSSNMDTEVLLAGMEREQVAACSRAEALLAWVRGDEIVVGAFVAFYCQELAVGSVQAEEEEVLGDAGTTSEDPALDGALQALGKKASRSKASKARESVLDSYVDAEPEEEEEEEVSLSSKRGGRKARAESESSVEGAPVKRKTRAGSDLSAVVEEVPAGRKTRSGSDLSTTAEEAPVKRKTRAGSDLSAVVEEAPIRRKTRSNSDLEDKVANSAVAKKQRWR